MPFTADGVTKEDVIVPQTCFGWSSEDVDMQARFLFLFPGISSTSERGGKE